MADPGEEPWQDPHRKKKQRGKQRYAPPRETSSHPLHNKHCFWYYEPAPDQKYEDGINKIGEFNTVEGFWATYTHILKPHSISLWNSEIQMFKAGISPMWEDEQNSSGGKWQLRVRKEFGSYLWEKLLMCVVGEKFNVGKEVNGVVINVKEHFHTISVWNRTGSNRFAKERIKECLMEFLQLPEGTVLEYRHHNRATAGQSRRGRRGQRGQQQQQQASSSATSSGPSAAAAATTTAAATGASTNSPAGAGADETGPPATSPPVRSAPEALTLEELKQRIERLTSELEKRGEKVPDEESEGTAEEARLETETQMAAQREEDVTEKVKNEEEETGEE